MSAGFLAFVDDATIAQMLIGMASTPEGQKRIREIARKVSFLNQTACGFISTSFDNTRAQRDD